jgi:hypothetical protein
MASDVVPVLLTLRSMRNRHLASGFFFAWPELTVQAPDESKTFNIDLLVSTGRAVWVFEVKKSASGLKQPQFRRVMKISGQLGARPGLSALEGEFADASIEMVNGAGGSVLMGDNLVT